MAHQEFAIIEKHFRDSGLCFAGIGVDLAIGDDCALLSVDPEQQLAISMDLLQEGVHFPEAAVPELLGQRALAVNLSDLAAMGAEPICFTLGLSLPQADDTWLEAFSRGLLKIADRFDCPLIGGDLMQGILHIAIQVQGQVPRGQALLRSGARPGHLLYVTGTLGDSAAALALFDELSGQDTAQQQESPFIKKKLSARDRDHFVNAFYVPEPRIAFGQAIRKLASAAIDVSDGLLSDLGHILGASEVGAELDVAQIPFSDAMLSSVREEKRLEMALTGGDDYELCITVPPENCHEIEALAKDLDVPLTRIGEVVSGSELRCLDSHGEPLTFESLGYSHFSMDSQ